jgi:ABC-type multidrug transport system ATPase subunit
MTDHDQHVHALHDAHHVALCCRALTKDHGEGRGLNAVDLDLPAGQRLAIVGHNGSGKTTLLRMVAGLSEPTSGHAQVFGEPAGSVSARAHVAYVGDQPVFYDDLSLREHLHYVAGLYGAADDDRADQLLKILGLTERADDLPTRFSRGLRQKAALAVALARPFRLLLIDEPFVGLDTAGRRALLTLVDEAAAQGATVVMATHDRDLASTAQRVVVLADGSVTHDGSVADLETFMGPV